MSFETDLAAAANIRDPRTRREAIQIVASRQQMAVLRADIKACRRCPLGSSRVRATPPSGPRSPIAIIGEAPGRNEERLGAPFVGRAGKLLDTLLHQVGWDRDDLFVMNTICCRPPKNDYRHAMEVGAVSACGEFRHRQLEWSGAWLVIAMGGRSITVTKNDQRAVKVHKARGTPYWAGGRLHVPTYHPAYALRQPEMVDAIAEDLELARRLFEGWSMLPRVTLEQAGFVPDRKKFPTKAMRDRLVKRGWVPVRLTKLRGEEIVVTDRWNAKVEPPYDKLPLYHVSEFVHLGELVSKGCDPDLFRAVHAVKKELGGQVEGSAL